MFHECLESYNEGKSWKKTFKMLEKEYYDNTFPEQIAADGDMAITARLLLESYFDYYQDEDIEYLENEKYFCLPLGDGIYIEGYIDSIVEDLKGNIYPFETKTYKSIPKRENLLFNQQSAIYLWAAIQFYENVEGTYWNIIKAKRPSVPDFNKDGSISKKSIDSTPTVVLKWLQDQGLKATDHADLLTKVKYEDFFFREKIKIQRPMVIQVIDDCKSTLQEIEALGRTRKEMNIDNHCSFCEFRSLCQAELMGWDVEEVIKREFIVKEEESGKENDNKDKEESYNNIKKRANSKSKGKRSKRSK